MKFFILISFFVFNSYADYTPKCGAAYSKLKASTNLDAQETTLSVFPWDVKKQTGNVKAVLDHYIKNLSVDMTEMYREKREFRVKIQNLIKEDGSKIKGYQITVDTESDEDIVKYTVDAKKGVINGYWYNQSPMMFWVCEGY